MIYNASSGCCHTQNALPEWQSSSFRMHTTATGCGIGVRLLGSTREISICLWCFVLVPIRKTSVTLWTSRTRLTETRYQLINQREGIGRNSANNPQGGRLMPETSYSMIYGRLSTLHPSRLDTCGRICGLNLLHSHLATFSSQMRQ